MSKRIIYLKGRLPRCVWLGAGWGWAEIFLCAFTIAEMQLVPTKPRNQKIHWSHPVWVAAILALGPSSCVLRFLTFPSPGEWALTALADVGCRTTLAASG